MHLTNIDLIQSKFSSLNCGFDRMDRWCSFLVFMALFCLGLPQKSSISCHYTPGNKPLEIYYINMDKSVERRINMEKLLNITSYPYFRVRGLSPTEIFIPEDVEKTWRTAWCKMKTDMEIPMKSNLGPNSPLFNMSSIMVGLCGRGKNKNTPKELGCTTSHLLAMRNAIYSATARSKYALIVEDDVSFPFNIDFEALAASAPSDFGILQLFNSNKDSLKDSFLRYSKNPSSELWSESKNLKFWSTCGYLINREVMKPIIDSVVNVRRGFNEFTVLAGIQGPCSPPECCVNNLFVQPPPCVWASFGYQADSYLYSMTKTYMLNIPLIANGKGVNASTFHQEHVEMFHRQSFRKMRLLMKELISGSVPLPSFARPACDTFFTELEQG